MNEEIMRELIAVLERVLVRGDEMSLSRIISNMTAWHQEYIHYHEMQLGNYLNILCYGHFEVIDASPRGAVPIIHIKRLR